MILPHRLPPYSNDDGSFSLNVLQVFGANDPAFRGDCPHALFLQILDTHVNGFVFGNTVGPINISRSQKAACLSSLAGS